MAKVEFALRKEEFMAELNKKEWSIEEFASRANISFVTVYRVLNGERKPGNRFIASTLSVFDSTNINDFFLIQLSPNGEKRVSEVPS